MERLHNSLIGFSEIHTPSFKNFPETCLIPAAFVLIPATSTFLNNLSKQSSVIESNLKFLDNESFS